jgi:subtilisin family serine protease
MRAVLILLIALTLGPLPEDALASPPSRQLVVRIAPRPGASPALEATTPRSHVAGLAASLGLRVVGSLADGLSLAGATLQGGARPGTNLRANPFDLDPGSVWLLEARDSLAAAAAAAAIAGDPAIAWVEFNQPREPEALGVTAGFPNDPGFRDTRQWGLRNLGPHGAFGGVEGADIDALGAWGWTTGRNDLRLAVADTGIDPNHPELQALIPGVGPRVTLGMNVSPDPSPSYADSFYHGTAVAGVMAALTNDGAHFDSLGVAGVCGGDGNGNFGCRIVPIKIAAGHSGDASSYDIARAILYATQVGARAMNLSFAGGGQSAVERDALYYAITRGCVVVAAAGNRGASRQADAAQFPAAYAALGYCIQAGASDEYDQRTRFSSYGPGLDLLAPGVDVLTTFPTYPIANGTLLNGYVQVAGTSFSAPHTTGVVGLLAALRPELSASDFQHVLRESARDLAEPGLDQKTGYGRLDAARALASVAPSFGILHDEVAAATFIPGDVDSLIVGTSGPGLMDRIRHWPRARAIEARATVALPDSFLDSVRVWTTVQGTMTVAGGFRLPFFAPWSEIVERGPRSFTLRGFLYQLEDCLDCGGDAHLPLPPDQARFGYTVIGRVDRPPTLEITAPLRSSVVVPGDTIELGLRASDPDRVTAIEAWLESSSSAPLLLARLDGDVARARMIVPCPPPFHGAGTLRLVARDEHGPWRDETAITVPIAIRLGSCEYIGLEPVTSAATPNPFRESVRIPASTSARLVIVDVAGRVVRREPRHPEEGGFTWDGRDDAGRRVAAGIYLARFEGERRSPLKLLKLE